MRKLHVKLFALSVFVFLFQSCSRFQKKPEKKPNDFEVYVPMEEDYPLLTRGLFSSIENVFPKAKITLHEGLSDKYVIAPFDEWILKSDSDGILRLQIQVERSEDLNPILAFLIRDEAKIPFKVKIPKPDTEASETKGEALFCRMKADSDDLFERQLCKELHNALCARDSRLINKKFNVLGTPSCSLKLNNPVTTVVSKAKPKLFFLTGFPLPIKVKNDYPFARFGEIDEMTLLSLFANTELDMH